MNQPIDVVDAAKRATGLLVADVGTGHPRIPRGHGFGPRTEENQPQGRFSPTGKFGRMFPDLRPLVPSIESLDALAREMQDRGPQDDPDDQTGDNPGVSAGFTYFGQFVDHDITLHPGGVLGRGVSVRPLDGPPGSGSPDSVPIPSDWIIDWRRFFEVGTGAEVGLSRLLDPFLAPTLQNLPNVPPPNSLAARNLRRGRSLGLPPGQAVARYLGIRPLSPTELSRGRDGAVARRHGLHIETPLWYYILKEAQIRGRGRQLGPVGSRIVAEVFVGLLEADSSSYLARDRDWTPTLPSKRSGDFTLADLIEFVGDLNPIGDAPAIPPPAPAPGP